MSPLRLATPHEAPAPARRRGGSTLVGVLLAAVGGTAAAGGLTDHGADLFPRQRLEAKLSGSFRTRADWLYNLDLDRGVDSDGRPLFAVPLSNPRAQALTSADMRLRTDLALYAPFASIAVKVRTDVIDNLELGSTPVLSPGSGIAPTPAASPAQLPVSLLKIRRAYAEALTPIGMLTAGRMSTHWGLGLLSHGGDRLDDNGGDAADRVAFVTALLRHLWAVAYDIGATGPLALRPGGARTVLLDPSTAVQSVTFAVMHYRDELAITRRRRAGKLSIDYGLTGAYRWQTADAPASYLATHGAATLGPTAVMHRGYRAGVADLWLRLLWPRLRVEAEGAALFAQVDQASLIPGALFRAPLQGLQVGAALETQLGAPESLVVGGLNAGFASGDPAPGMGAFPRPGATPRPGVLDAPQVALPSDGRVDNFRFHPDYRIDRILFAEIIGTVTDAVYVRPWAKVRLLDFSSSALTLAASATWTRAVYASSTPGGRTALGLEGNTALNWVSRDGFDVLLEYAALFPLAGLDNPVQRLSARPAQLLRARLAWSF